MRIDLIGLPTCKGSNILGVEEGPSKIRSLGIEEIITKNGFTYIDKGNINIDKFLEPLTLHNINNYQYILEASKLLSQKVKASLDSNAFSFILGGDHSLSIGSLAASTSKFNKLAVIWIDAHSDINTNLTSPTGNAHGMGLAIALGYGPKEMRDLFTNYLNPENIHIIGLRSVDSGEQELIEKLNINYYNKQTIYKKGIEQVIESIFFQLEKNKVDNIHLSLDVDVLDPSLVPGTGTPVPDGLNILDLESILSKILKSSLVRLIDFVEYNPSLDDSKETTKQSVKSLLSIIFSNLS